jgi:hypothetical protein
MNGTGAWTDISTIESPLNQANGTGTRTVVDTTAQFGSAYQYRVVAKNTVGYGGAFPAMTVQSISDPVSLAAVLPPGPNAPTNLTANPLFNPTRIQLSWRDASTNENLFQVWRSVNGGAFSNIGTVNRNAAQRAATGGAPVTFTNFGVAAGNTYSYYVVAVNTVPNPDQPSLPSNMVSVTIVLPTPPAAPSNLTGAAVRIPGSNFLDAVTLTWADNSGNETGFQIQRSFSPNFTNANTYNVGANVTTFNQNVSRTFNYYYRVRAVNAAGNSAWSNVQFVTTP